MHIEYVNIESPNPEDIAKTHVVVGGQKRKIPQTSFAYAQAYTDNAADVNYDRAIEQTYRLIRSVIDAPALDDARYIVISYRGDCFERSLHYKDALLYGKYGFKAVLTDNRLLLGVANEQTNEIEFLKPEIVFN